ncbi:metalloregulator ArsR/SmtB family transcription factor [Massilia sp. TS11]|uniref:ArsR/SmtB family transcription factor n=1 Tax=Massilia sp. TS11 TaxID=2908003 RepID=UPI001EDC5274|nr:metalloregulator ArsR/SmtB family transcription factor [Massilia sp. TS11]MCG2583805.1 metalloregulator ArsR/SmtB family transcription factor [Massilia sp. TS11]
MPKENTLPPEVLPHVAAYFRALSEPVRLQLLNLLREGEFSVGELAERIGSSVANTSRHLTLLAQHGLVQREGRGNSVYYKIADPVVDALCDLVCGSLAERFRHMDAALNRRR